MKLCCKQEEMHNRTHRQRTRTKEHKQDRMMLGREHTSHCEKREDRGHEGEVRQRAGREDWVGVHMVRVLLKTAGSVS